MITPSGILGNWEWPSGASERWSKPPIGCAAALKGSALLPSGAHPFRCLPVYLLFALHAGAGGARSRAIQRQDVGNTCRDTGFFPKSIFLSGRRASDGPEQGRERGNNRPSLPNQPVAVMGSRAAIPICVTV